MGGGVVAYDDRMAKTLAGVLAVSMAALLFAGCGGGESSSSSDRVACADWSAFKANPSPAGSGGNAQRMQVIADTAKDKELSESLYRILLALDGTVPLLGSQYEALIAKVDSLCSTLQK